MKEIKSGIYVIENLINGRKYVGQGNNLDKRMNEYHANSKALNAAMDKYGKDNFNRYVIEYCSIEELDERERYWIKELRSHTSEKGYNISWGGHSPMRGISPSIETRKKLSMSRIGTHPSDETREKMSIAKAGKPRSEEVKEKMRITRKGENNSFYGMHHSDETKEKMRLAKIGTHPSEEAKKARDKATNSDEYKKKQRDSHTGLHHSDVTRKKMSETQKKRWFDKKNLL